MSLGVCFRTTGDCQYGNECERCPYLRIDSEELARLRAIEADTLARPAQASQGTPNGEIARLTETLQSIADKKVQAEKALAAV